MPEDTNLDKVERVEELQNELLSLIVDEGERDGCSDYFHDQLDGAQACLMAALEFERGKTDA